MTTATTETTRLTSDPVPPDELRADVARLFEAMAAGGIGIVPLVDTDYDGDEVRSVELGSRRARPSDCDFPANLDDRVAR